MKEIEAELFKKKEELDGMKAPEEMEARLRDALNRKRRGLGKRALAAVLIAAMLGAYSFDTLAYYGKKFIGYDDIVVGSLKKLNEEGRGQEINKSCRFSNGVQVTVDGIMLDETQLVAFYKVHSDTLKLDSSHPMLRIAGFKPEGYFFQGGQGHIVDDYTITFIDTFEPPQFYEKWMSFKIRMNIGGRMEEQSIGFTLDRNRAMNRTFKKDLHAQVTIGENNIIFDSLKASVMSTVVEGRINPLTEKAANAFKGEDAVKWAEAPNLVFDIETDSGAVNEFRGGNAGTSGDKISFSKKSDALPDKFNGLQIKNIRLETLKLVDKSVDIGPETAELAVGGDLTVKKVFFEGDTTCVVVSSKGIPVMGLFADDRKQIEEEDPGKYDREAESEQAVERTFRFKGKAQNMKLEFKCVRYLKYSHESINIPVE